MVISRKNKKVTLLAGPTASGKSALALKWAEENRLEIVNADSMQVYDDLRDLTARPSLEEEERVPHHLYGILKGSEICSAERWRELALCQMEEIWLRGSRPLVVGGTGLYFKTLLQGLSPIPDIDPDIRARLRRDVQEEGPGPAFEKLQDIDPQWASRISEADAQRICRGLEVFLSTGKTITYWQQQPGLGGLEGCDDLEIEMFVLEPERHILYQRCDLRFEKMVREGRALEEVTALLEKNYPSENPVMKALGVSQLSDYIEGRLSLEEAMVNAQTATRQYAKRQLTWFRNQCGHWPRVQ